jgi:ArsR family transcriptional regulator
MKLDKVLKALADSTRLRVLNILLQREVCVCDLQSVLELPQSFLSRHLAYLRSAGLVRDRREGPRVWYSLTLEDDVGHAVREFLQRVLPLFETFQADSTKMQAFTECCQSSGVLQKKSNRQQAVRSNKEMSYGHQSSTVQL